MTEEDEDESVPETEENQRYRKAIEAFDLGVSVAVGWVVLIALLWMSYFVAKFMRW